MEQRGAASRMITFVYGVKCNMKKKKDQYFFLDVAEEGRGATVESGWWWWCGGLWRSRFGGEKKGKQGCSACPALWECRPALLSGCAAALPGLAGLLQRGLGDQPELPSALPGLLSRPVTSAWRSSCRWQGG